MKYYIQYSNETVIMKWKKNTYKKKNRCHHLLSSQKKTPTSRSDSLVLAWLREKPPMSLEDLLVLAVVSVVEKRGTNES